MTETARKTLWILAAAVVLQLVGWSDYRGGYQVGLFAFYALPIAWIAWSVNFTWAFILAVGNTVARIWTDASWIHHYAHVWIPWERGFMRLTVLVFIAYSFHQFRRDLDDKSLKLKQLEGILPVCIVCNRISDGTGHWTDLGTYLRLHSAATPETQLCPDCASVRYR